MNKIRLMLYYNYTFMRVKTLLCSLFYSITIFKKPMYIKFSQKKNFIPIFSDIEFISIIPIEISIIQANDGDIFKLMECDN